MHGFRSLKMEDSAYKRYRTPIYIILMILLLLARDVFDFSFNKYIFVAIVLFFMLASSYLDSVYMFAFTMPLLYGLPNTYIMLVTLAILIMKRPKINARFLAAIIVFALLEIVATIGYMSFSWIDIIGYLCAMALFLIYVLGIEDIDPKKCVEMYLLGSVILCGIIIISGIKASPSNWLNAYATGYYRFGNIQVDENSGMTLKVNANTLAYYSIVGISMCLVLLKHFEHKQIKGKIIHVAYILLFVLAGILSASRTWVYLLVIVLVLFAVTQFKSIRGGATFAVSAAAVVFVVMKAVQRLPQLYSGLMMRLERGDVVTGNGRIEIFQEYFEGFFHNPRFILLGTGVTHANDAIGINKSMHNGLQQIIVFLGIVGATIFLITILRPVVQLIRERIKFIYWIPLIAVILFTQTIQFINPYNLMFPYAIALYFIMIGRKQNELFYNNG
jgi:O-antigen ligase